MVAIGSKQRSYEGYEKSDGSSPTVKTDSIFLTGVIDAREKRRIRIFDIANAFVKGDNDEFVLMVLRGRMAELMVRVNPELYREYVQYSNKGVPMLYVQLSKALYGMLRAALLFYKTIARRFGRFGFYSQSM